MTPLKTAADGDVAETEADFDGVGSHLSAASGRRTCIVVLGMHRSGTSALTRVLSLLGAALPKDLMGAAPSNETGHWEPQKLADYHDALLLKLQSAWNDWTALDLSQLTAERRGVITSRIAEIINGEYGDAPLMVVKEPRICRFAPLFLEALKAAGITPECVLTFRNPLEVALSLERRNRMSRGDAGLLWLRHVLDSEAATRASRRAILSYDGLLADWRGEIRRMSRADAGAGTGQVWPRPIDEAATEIDRFLSPEQRHHTLSAADIMHDPFMSSWIAEVYDALRQLQQYPSSATALATLDRVRGEFDRAASVISRMQRDEHTRLTAELAVRCAAEMQQTGALAARLAGARAEIEAALKRLGAAPYSPDGPAAGHVKQTLTPAPIADLAEAALWLEGLPHRLEGLPQRLEAPNRWRRCLLAPVRKARAALRKALLSGSP
jgi:hypothetical protein